MKMNENIKVFFRDMNIHEKRYFIKEAYERITKGTSYKQIDRYEEKNRMIFDGEFFFDFNTILGKKIAVVGRPDRAGDIITILKNIKGIQSIVCAYPYADSWKNKTGEKAYDDIPVRTLSDIYGTEDIDDYFFVLTLDDERRWLTDIEKNYGRIKRLVTWTAFYTTVYCNISNDCFEEGFRKWFIKRNETRSKRRLQLYYSEVLNELFAGPGILVYQCGKVGSKSIANTLRKMGYQVSHLHMLNVCSEEGRNYCHDFRDEYSYWIERLKSMDKVKIISAVREPISRSISHYIQNMEPDCMRMKGSLRDYIKEDAFTEKNGFMFEWFNSEIRDVFGIDIYQYPFDREKGYTIIQKNNVEILLLTLEKMNSNSRVIGNFIGETRDFQLLRSNDGEDKITKYLYKYIKDNVTIPESVIEKYYHDNEAMRHFYDEEDIKRFEKKWKNRIGKEDI